MTTSLLVLPVLLLLLALSPNPVTSALVLESGYSVSTLVDFNKIKTPSVHPFALQPTSRSSFLLLDSTNSAFYSLSAPLSQEADVSLYSGKGVAGFADGDRNTAMFDKPRSFAIDERDNIYVADRGNGAIRKISPSGMTTTIAGGYSKKTGHADGPAQNASFSNDFDLVYVPTTCTLLISDRGSRLIRELKLKPEDCVEKSPADLGVMRVSIVAVVSLLVGLVLGFAARQFFASREISSNNQVNKTWKHFQTHLGRLRLTAYSGIRNVVAESKLIQLGLKLVKSGFCYLSIVFRNIRLEKRVQYDRKGTYNVSPVCSRPVSLLDSDAAPDYGVSRPASFADQLRDLITFDEGASAVGVSGLPEKDALKDDSEGDCHKINDMINANLSGFVNQPKEIVQLEGFSAGGSPSLHSTAGNASLVQRRPMRIAEL